MGSTILPSGTDKEAVRSLAETASIMECLVSLSQENSHLGNRVLQDLKSLRTPSDFREQMSAVFKDLFQLQHLPDIPDMGDGVVQFSQYLKHSRQPTALAAYAGKVQNGLFGHENESMMAAITQFVQAAVLSSNPEQAFKRLRYDPTKSSHLRLLADKARFAFAEWQKPCTYQPSAAFLAGTSNSTKQVNVKDYLKQRVVTDKHVPSGTYPLLEQVLTERKPLASVLPQDQGQASTITASSQVERGLLQLLVEGTQMERADLITQLLAVMPQDQFPQFYQDLTDLKELLVPSTRQDNKQYSVIDTDAAEDLLLCGTEVAGSCQSIQGEVQFNKALMGYVLDGKYRMLAITSENGRLMGRRMLRLLWDKQAQRPVLHLERFYHNPGIPKKYEQALVELAQQKARQVGCALVSHDDKALIESGRHYRAPLIAYPTSWPFEYIDAEGLGVRAGEAGYQLSKARIVALPR